MRNSDRAFRLYAAFLAALITKLARADDSSAVVAISSRISSGYSRAMLSEGVYKPETYTFGEGGRLPGTARDDSIDKLTFLEVAKTIAGPLEKRNFVPVADRNPEETKLLIMVYWGTTSGNGDASDSSQYQNLQRDQGNGPKQAATVTTSQAASIATSGPAANQQARVDAATRNARESSEAGEMASVLAENWQRDQADTRNAMLLGYDAALSGTDDVGSTPMTHYRDDLISEIEEDRYFVVLMAYDYQALWKHRKHSLLWVTRMSVRARGTNFTRVLPSMVTYGSQYFGISTNGLLRREVPEGHVEIGEPKSIGTLP